MIPDGSSGLSEQLSINPFVSHAVLVLVVLIFIAYSDFRKYFNDGPVQGSEGKPAPGVLVGCYLEGDFLDRTSRMLVNDGRPRDQRGKMSSVVIKL